VIVLDTTVLVYSLGADHARREPSRRLVDAIGAGDVVATTTAEVVQEFAHVFARRRPRAVAAQHARGYAALLSPLLGVGASELDSGFALFERHEPLDCFDAVLAAAALANNADALVSADRSFSAVPGLRHLVPGAEGFEELFA
jgi:predicted nucleic acid-binding protein